MEDFNSISPEHRILIQSLIDGSIAEADIPLINQELREDSLLRAFYIEQSRMDSHLRDYHTKAVPLIVLGENKRISKKKIISIAAGSIALGVAAAVAVMFSIGGVNNVPADSGEALVYSQFTASPNPVPLARITGMEDIRWAGATGDLQVGTWLSAGKIELKEGLIEITYDSGSSVIVKAPATYYIEENNRGFLQRGQIRAHSPKTVAKFEIETPNSQLVDLGTSFGVSTLSDESTSVHVFEGFVKALASGDSSNKWKELREGDALEINDGINALANYKVIKAAPSQFDWAPTRRATRSKSISYLHWSFDKLDSSAYEETGTGMNGSHYPAKLSDLSSTPSKDSWQTSGQFDQALSLNGDNRFLQTTYDGIAGNKPRTIACWIKMPKQAPARKDVGAVVCWGRPAHGQLWKMTMRSNILKQNDLYLLSGAGWGYTSGDTKLNDGKWHHVVSVFTGGSNADSGANVLHYVDGRLESRRISMSRRVNTAADTSKHYPLLIGLALEVPAPKNLPAMISSRKKMGQQLSTFKGAIDELYVFDGALTPKEISQLMETNTPPQ